MVDESELARILAGYGEGYRNPLMDGPLLPGVSGDFTTQNVLAGMDARQASQDDQGRNALMRILLTLGGLRSSAATGTMRDSIKARDLERRLDAMEATGKPSWDRGITGGGPRVQGGVPRSADDLANFRRPYEDPYRGYGVSVTPREGVHSASNPSPLGGIDSWAGRWRYMRPANE